MHQEAYGCAAVNKTIPLNLLDILEMEREKLHALAGKYALTSPQVLRQSKLVDCLILACLKKNLAASK